MGFEFFIGRRYLRTRRKEAFIFLITLLSVVGVTVGVMALIVVIAVMAGFESDLRSRILGIETHIIVEKKGAFDGYRTALKRIQQIEGIVAAAPYIDSQVMVRSLSRSAGILVRGIDPKRSKNIYGQFDTSLLEERRQDDDALNRAGDPGIVLGQALAASLGALEGDAVYVISPRGTLSPFGHLPGMRRFRVAGTFSTGVYEYDGSLAFIHLDAAQSLFRMGEGITGIAVQIADMYQAGVTAGKIAEELGPAVKAEDWMQRNSSLFSALKLEKAAMSIILALIILVAAFNIAGTLMMMVMEKTKDIAILKAMGATRKSIRKIFMLKGTIIGLIGVGFGTCIGTGLCVLLKRYKFVELPDDVYYITTLPVRLDVYDVLAIGAAALVICFAATVYPAHQASKFNPLEAIRYG